MDIPAPFNYNTETFDPDMALKHVLEYPAFKNALTNHQEELYTYLEISRSITGAMAESFEARRLYHYKKTLFKFCYKAALRIAGYSTLMGLGLLGLSFLGPLAAYQSVIWSGLGIGACLFIALPLAVILRMSRKVYETAEKQLKDIHDIEIWINEFHAHAHVSDVQDGMIAGVGGEYNDYSLKVKAVH